MGSEATIQDENGKTEAFGLSVLDVTKHALKTIVKSLSPQDEFSLVSFSSEARVEMEPRMMTVDGAKTALDKIEALQPENMTNLWGGLKKGLDVLTESKPHTNNVALFLLTDGLPNVSPGKGESKALEAFKANNKGLPCRIHTFGFGYQMNSVMLSSLAGVGGGAYSFIPDSSFVGTVFVNAVANHITTCANDLRLEINGKHVAIAASDHSAYNADKEHDDKHLSFEFGSIQYGQQKNIVFPIKKTKSMLGGGTPYLEFNLKYSTDGAKNSVEKTFDWSANTVQNDADIKYHRMRLALVKGVTDSLEKSGLDFQYDNFRAKDLSKAQKHLSELEKSMNKLVSDNEDRSKDLMKDLTGQIQEAFSKNEYFVKWGVHFCLSIKTAHLNQFCNNFKDPGVQHYCSELFSETRDRLDNIFITLPAPKPSIPITHRTPGVTRVACSGPVNMAQFMNLRGGCFLGSSKVHVPGQVFKRADCIVKGDKVITGAGVVDEVECVLKTVLDETETTEMVRVNKYLTTTLWHPIKSEDGIWTFPAESGADLVNAYINSVYSFLLKSRGTILIGDVECATLAHGLKGHVIGHEFLGEETVARDMKQFDTFNSGLVQVTPTSFKRDVHSGKIIALQD